MIPRSPSLASGFRPLALFFTGLAVACLAACAGSAESDAESTERATATLAYEGSMESAAASPGAFRIERLASDPHGGGDASLAPDGESFVISSRRSGHWDLWQFHIESGEWTQLTTHEADDFEARFSPDSQRLAFTSSRGGAKHIWSLRLADGMLEQLTDGEHEEEYPDWSPDGRTIAYTAGPWKGRDIWAVPSDGAAAVGGAAGVEPRRLTRASGQAGACAWDPTGTSLVCHRYDQGSGDLERLYLDGETAPLTLDARAWDYKPNASPRGDWVAFSRSIEGPSRLWILPADGGRARQLTDSPWDDRWPNWSADGTTLFFHRVVDRGIGIEVRDLESGAIEEIVGLDEGPLQAAFDPTGRRVVYCSVTDSGRRLRVVSRGAGSGSVAAEPHTLDIFGGEARVGAEACYPRWSPDGRRIAYAVRPDAAARWEIGVVSVDEDGRATAPGRILTAGYDHLRGLDGPLDWSPDSRSLVFHGDTDPYEAALYSLDVEAALAAGDERNRTALRSLTDDAWFDEAPSFTPSGDGVLFMSTRGGGWTWGLFELSLVDGSIEPFSGPDYDEKNFARRAVDGSTLWTAVSEAGETLKRLWPDGRIDEIARGGRWPAVSADGRSVLYTRLDHQVEYWRIQNPMGEGSPARRAEATAPTTLAALDRDTRGSADVPYDCSSAVREPQARLARFEGYRRQSQTCEDDAEPSTRRPVAEGAPSERSFDPPDRRTRDSPAREEAPDRSPVDLHHR